MIYNSYIGGKMHSVIDFLYKIENLINFDKKINIEIPIPTLKLDKNFCNKDKVLHELLLHASSKAYLIQRRK